MKIIFRRRCFGSQSDNLKLVRLSVIAFVLVTAGTVAQAQQTKKIFRIGYLSSKNTDNESARAEGIRLALRQRGYAEGENSRSSTAILTVIPSGLPSLRPSWCG